MSDVTGAPLKVSIVIPAYESQATLRATLESLRRQTFTEFETILVDSGRTNEVERIAAEFPMVRYHRSARRMLPHEARNLGVRLAAHDFLAFTDPDIVATPAWLENLVTAYQRSGRPISGSVACVQRDWITTGIHFAKFDIWLPGGKKRAVPVAASVNFFCSKELIDDVGGFDGSEMIGDTLLSWDIIQQGVAIEFAPDAVVYHDHRSSFRDLLRERYVRGADFGRLRSEREDWTPLRTLGMILASIVPLRLARLTGRTLGYSIRGRCLFNGLRTLPIFAAGHAAWLGGEISQYLKRLAVRSAAPQPKQACM